MVEGNDQNLYGLNQDKRSGVSRALSSAPLQFTLIILFVVITTAAFNYFGIVPLSKISPTFFGFLPQQDEQSVIGTTQKEEEKRGEIIQKQDNDATSSIPTEIISDVYLPFAPCPIKQISECKTGEIVSEGEGFYGAQYRTLTAGTEIVASMDGLVNFEVENGVNSIVITGKYSNQKMLLSFIGDTVIPLGLSSISQFEKIGEVSDNSKLVNNEYMLRASFLTPSGDYSKFSISEDDGSFVKKRTE